MELGRFSFVLAWLLIIALGSIITPAMAANHTLNPGDSIQTAINSAHHGDTIILNPGTYNEHNITISKNIIIRANVSAGGNRDNTIIDAMNLDRIFSVNGAYSFTVDGLTLQNGDATGAGGAIYNLGSFSISNSTITDCQATYSGGAIYSRDNSVTITSSTFSNCLADYGGAIYSISGNVTVTSSTFFKCSASATGGAILSTRSGPGIVAVNITFSSFSDCEANNGGGAIYSVSNNVTISSSTFSNCLATTTGNGGAISCDYGGDTSVISSTFTGCSATLGSAIYVGTGNAKTIRFSRFIDDPGTAVYNKVGTLNATNNWWGTNADPSVFTSGGVTVSPWLVLDITAHPASITTAHIAFVRTNLTRNSAGIDTTGGGVFVPNGIKNTFAVTTCSGSVLPLTNKTVNGVAKTRFTPESNGTSRITATVDGQSVTASIVVTGSSLTPTVTGITPGAGVRGNLITITNLSGTNFAAGAKVFLNRTGYPLIPATNVTVLNAKKITCTFTIPANAPLGLRKVDVKNTNGKLGTRANAFMVRAPVPPTVTGITPAFGNRGKLITITNLSGTGFVASPKPTVQLVKNSAVIAAANVTVISAKKISCKVEIPAGTATGAWNVMVTNVDQQSGTKAGAFTVKI